MSCHSISGRLSSGLWQDDRTIATPLFYLFILLCQPFCCRFASVLWSIIVLGVQRCLRTTQWLQGAQVLWLQSKLTPPVPCATTGMRCLCWNTVFGFLQKVMLYTIFSHLHFGLFCPKDIVAEILCLLWCNFAVWSHGKFAAGLYLLMHTWMFQTSYLII